MYNLLNRIHKGVSEEIKLVFLTEDVFGYIFFVLGGSNFIYRVIINKKFQKCNCEDYYNHNFLCKHILFILFKVVRVYRFDFNNNIFLRREDYKLQKNIKYSLKSFLFNNKFPDLDWYLFKKYLGKLKVKENYFILDLHDKFKEHYRKYNYLARKNLKRVSVQCPICKDKTKYAVKCDICKSYFHVECIFTWLNKIVTKRCPICRSSCWETIYPYYHFIKNDKIPLDLIK